MASGERVTLSDFHRLQAQLLATRQELYDSQEREANAASALKHLRAAASFPPPPPRATATPPRATASTSPVQRYPEALNPFGADADLTSPHPPAPPPCAPDRRTCDAHTQTTELDTDMSVVVRDVAVRERCAGAQRTMAVRRHSLLRLVFHGWRASQASTKILRNMGSLIQAQAAAAGTQQEHAMVAVRQTSPLAPRGDPPGVATSSTEAEASLRYRTAELSVVAAELHLLEGHLEILGEQREGLRASRDEALTALREVSTTAGALYGRTLCALETAGSAASPGR